MKITGQYFYGNKISNYGLQYGLLDYGTLAKAFDSVLNNEIIRKTCDKYYWEQISGYEQPEEDEEYLEVDIYQYYIIDGRGADIPLPAAELPLSAAGDVCRHGRGARHGGAAGDRAGGA